MLATRNSKIRAVTVALVIIAGSVVAYGMATGGSSGRTVKVGSDVTTAQTEPATAASSTVYVNTVPPLATVPVSTPACPTPSSVQTRPSTSLDLTLTNSAGGFAASCYYGVAGQPLRVTLVDNITNSSTGLTNPMAFTVSPVSAPDFGQLAGAPQRNLTRTRPASTVFNSPTAPDTTPITFTIPALGAGQYYLALTTLPSAAPAILIMS